MGRKGVPCLWDFFYIFAFLSGAFMEYRILFVCLGNICRSPMAEAIMRKMVSDVGMSGRIAVDSAGTSSYHLGDLPDMRMRQFARQCGYELTHRARRVCSDDFSDFDMLIGMDDRNIADLKELAPDPDAEKKIFRMADFTDIHGLDHVPDPYYGGADGFRLVVEMLEDGCGNLLKMLLESLDKKGTCDS